MKKQAPAPSKTELQVLHIVKDFLNELESERALRAVAIDASLEKDLGIGSLERAELFHRIEKAFVIQLPDQLIAEAESIRDIIPFIDDANPPGRIHYHEFFPTLDESIVDPSQCATLVDVLIKYAEHEPSRIHLYLQDEQGKEKIIRYGQLYEKALKAAKGLRQLGLEPRQTVAIMLPTCEAFFYAFFGVLLAGGLPVPIYPPFRPDRIEEYAKREAKILRNAEVRILISFDEVQILNRILRNFIPTLKAVVTIDNLMTVDAPFAETLLSGPDNALIQYTSGSTGDPKGVLLTHYNLLSNIRSIGEAINIKPTDVTVSWLPLYHDMGLIGSWLGSLYFGIPITILSPLSFLNHPERWLWAIHYHRATLSAGPNFAYELCVSKIEDPVIEGLDLSSWRLAFNGAEAIYPKTVRNFLRRFGPYGFKAESLYPVYGLAESSVALTFPPLNRHVRIDRINRDHFNHEQVATPCDSAERNCIEFVSCGKALPHHEIRIVNEQGAVLKDRAIGTLQFKGPSAMQGYYRHPKATKAIHHDGWWESGDLAYRADEEIFITGRKKDIIVKAGRNLYPQEIEEITGQIKGVRKGCVVAFGAVNLKHGTEQLIVIAETREQRLQQQEKIINDIIETITTSIGDPPDRVVLVPPKSIPKTSSGKLQRSNTKDLYLQGRLTKKVTPSWLQFVKLFLLGGGKSISRVAAKLFRTIYTVYVLLIIIITMLPTWLALWFLPQHSARVISKFWARTLLRLMGCPVTIKGAKHLHKNQSTIYVSNHMSYLDTVVLSGILPAGVLIVGKKELAKAPIIKKFITKLGHLTVERADFLESMSDTNFILTKLIEGNSILLFPEGTFSYAAGLRPFKLGAFKIATETGYPICPIAIRGTRQIFRSSRLFFRPHAIHLWIGKPIHPRSRDWREATRLKTVTRIEIAKHCGENVLDMVSTLPVTE
ncbi:MAG: AMP-binding protein [Gammaproteobacteria bacterium]|nr:AMP-binding protein [Gammaproteobacteria bacterium]